MEVGAADVVVVVAAPALILAIILTILPMIFAAILELAENLCGAASLPIISPPIRYAGSSTGIAKHDSPKRVEIRTCFILLRIAEGL